MMMPGYIISPVYQLIIETIYNGSHLIEVFPSVLLCVCLRLAIHRIIKVHVTNKKQ